jgi:hypothetical protein
MITARGILPDLIDQSFAAKLLRHSGLLSRYLRRADRQGRLGIGGGTLSHVTRVSPGLVGVRFAYL